jgi:hypothetical protein
MAAYQLILHSQELPTGLADAQAKLGEVVRKVIVQSETLAHHHQHFQWLEHRPRLDDFQNDYWARTKKLVPGAKCSASTEPVVRKFARCGEAFAEPGPAAIGAAAEIAQQQASDSKHPFRSINEPVITEATNRLLDAVVVTSPLTESDAVELFIRFMHVVDLLLQKRLFGEQEAYRNTAREAIRTLTASPSVAAQNAEASVVIGQLRMRVITISGYDHGFDQIFSQQLSGPLMAWIQTIWENTVALRDIVARASEQGFTSLEVEAPAAKTRISELLDGFGNFFPFEQSREVCESAIARTIQEAASSETIDVRALGSLFVKLATLAFDRTFVDQLSVMQINENAEHVVLHRISETLRPLIDQISQFGHLFHDYKYRVNHYLTKFKDRLHALSLEAVNTLNSCEKLAGAASEGGILGVPLGETKGLGSGARLLRSLKRKIRWFYRLHVSEIPFFKFVAEQTGLSEKAILHIDSGCSFTHCYTEMGYVRYWLPLSLVRSPVLLEPLRAGFFDLCIVDIGEADLDLFSLVYQTIEPMMRAGSVVILFARRTRGLELRRDSPEFIRGMIPGSGYTRIWYTSSARALLATRIVESARVFCRHRNLPRYIARPIEVASLLMAAPLSAGTACIEYLRKWPQTAEIPVNPISVTVEISVPCKG